PGAASGSSSGPTGPRCRRWASGSTAVGGHLPDSLRITTSRWSHASARPPGWTGPPSGSWPRPLPPATRVGALWASGCSHPKSPHEARVRHNLERASPFPSWQSPSTDDTRMILRGLLVLVVLALPACTPLGIWVYTEPTVEVAGLGVSDADTSAYPV